MRLILVLVVLLTGGIIGMNAVSNFQEIQQERQQQLCKVDPSFCTSNAH